MPDTNDSKPKKLLFIITKSNFGGAQKYVYELAVEAQARGYQVSVAAGGTGEAGAPSGRLFEKLHEAHIHTHFIPHFMRNMSPLREVLALFSLIKLILTVRPDVLHLTSSKAGGLGVVAGRICLQRNIIFTSHGLSMDEAWRPLWQRLLITIATWTTLSLAHHTILINTETYTRAQKLWGLKKKVHLIFNGIRPFPLLPKTEAVSTLKLSLPKDANIIGGIGELHPNKQWTELIINARKLPASVHVVIFGSGEEHPLLERLAIHHQIAERVHLVTNQQENAKQFLNIFDVFILPSAKEGLPYVLLEAGLATRAVIASNLPGNHDIIESGKEGLLIDPKSPEFLTSISMLLRDGGMCNRLASALHERVSSQFSMRQMYEKTFALYESKMP